MFKNWPLGDVIEIAKQSEHINAKEFIPIYDIIDSYIKKNNLIISDPRMLIDKKKASNTTYTIYGINIFHHANNLANIISEINIHVQLYTVQKNEEFNLSILGNNIIQFHNVRNIEPIIIDGYNVYPPHLDLITLYHKLYNPKYVCDWEDLAKTANALKHMIPKIPIPQYKNIDNKIILNWLKSRNDYILIGINAINILNNDSHRKVQIITSTPIENIVSSFSKLIFQSRGLHIIHKTKPAPPVSDPRLTVTTISICVKAGGKTYNDYILDIFNAAQYELVPYVVYNDLMIGTSNVLQSFLLIEAYMYSDKRLISYIHKTPITANTELYLGVYDDVQRYNKKKSIASSYYPYKPEQHRFQHGNYRKI